MSGASRRREQYRAAVVRNLACELADDVELCPRCSDGWIQPGTAAGRLGICPACWARHLAEAQRLAQKEIEARREYDRERQRASRARRESEESDEAGRR